MERKGNSGLATLLALGSCAFLGACNNSSNNSSHSRNNSETLSSSAVEDSQYIMVKGTIKNVETVDVHYDDFRSAPIDGKVYGVPRTGKQLRIGVDTGNGLCCLLYSIPASDDPEAGNKLYSPEDFKVGKKISALYFPIQAMKGLSPDERQREMYHEVFPDANSEGIDVNVERYLVGQVPPKYNRGGYVQTPTLRLSR